MYRLYLVWFACLLAMVTACAQVESPPAVVSEPTAPAHIEPVSPLPPPTPHPPVPLAELPPPPQCTFDQTVRQSRQQAEPLLEEYVFSEPRPLLEGISGVDVIQWLPDGRHLLVALIGNGRQVGLYDTQTNLFMEYFNGGTGFPETTVWQASLQAIIFSDRDENNQLVLKMARSPNRTRRANNIEVVATNLAGGHLGLIPSSQNISFSTGSEDSPIQRVIPARSRNADSVEIVNQPTIKYRLEPITDTARDTGQHYITAWHPDGNQFAYYNTNIFYLANAQTGEFCELELGEASGERWALSGFPGSNKATWSLNGRYLAIQTTTSLNRPVSNMEITILDSWTGELRLVKIEDYPMFVMFAWAPNGRELFVSALKEEWQPEYQIVYGHYIFDVSTGAYRQAFRDKKFDVGVLGGIQWSPNGNQLALTCALSNAPESYRLCLFDVEVKR